MTPEETMLHTEIGRLHMELSTLRAKRDTAALKTMLASVLKTKHVATAGREYVTTWYIDLEEVRSYITNLESK